MRSEDELSTSSTDQNSIVDEVEHDENDGKTLDATIIEDEDLVPNYNGVDAEEEDASESKYESTMALRQMPFCKNLVETFDRHAPMNEEKREGSNDLMGRVKEKVQAFEKSNSQVRFEDLEKTSASLNLRPMTRPPIAPVPKLESSSTSDSSLLSVYLRIRPLAYEEAPQDSSDTLLHNLNTVEILKPECNNGSRTSLSIRTYPPINSNTAKSARGQQHLLSNSNNTDQTDANNARLSEEAAAKGVKEYLFSQVFGTDSSQEDIYNGVADSLVDGLFSKNNSNIVGDRVVGQSALLFSYGMTNAGKTYTMMGKDKTKAIGDEECLSKDHGIIPRALNHIFSKMNGCKEVQYGLNMSYFEIYNEQIFDLLPKDKNTSHYKFGIDKSLRIREGRRGRTYIKGLGKHYVASFSHGMRLAHTANSKRHTSSNKINKDSSRSHLICQFELFARQPDQSENDDASVHSTASSYSTDEDSIKSNSFHNNSARMWIVDLAGSERSKRTGTFTRSARQKEATHINSSLMKLMRCMQTLRNKQSTKSSIIPFRESKLTHLLMDHLTGPAASRTSMMVNINPSASDFDETQHILSYATDARAIRISVADYKVKRSAIQTSDNAHNKYGEKLRILRKESNEKKLVRLAKKLSPRTVLAKKRDEMALTRKRKMELQTLRGSSAQNTGIVEKHVEKHAKRGKFIGSQNKKRRLEDEVRELQEALKKSQKEATSWKSNCTQLNDKLAKCESETRAELAEETKLQMDSMREWYNKTINRLQCKIESMPSKSAKKVLKDKREEMIEELIDKVDECEDEIIRMGKTHDTTIFNLKKEHSEQMKTKEIEIAMYLKKTEQQDEDIKILQNLSDGLKVERNDARQRYDNLLARMKETAKEEVDQYLSDDSGLLSSGTDSDLLSSCTEVSSPKEEKENENPCETGASSTPQMRRLPRRKCSEVACANISPINIEEVPSSKKKRLFCSALTNKDRSPFSAVPSINDNNQIRSGSSSKENKNTIVYPIIQPDYDENTGQYLRPRGRAPSGKKWDATLGAWCATTMLS